MRWLSTIGVPVSDWTPIEEIGEVISEGGGVGVECGDDLCGEVSIGGIEGGVEGRGKNRGDFLDIGLVESSWLFSHYGAGKRQGL